MEWQISQLSQTNALNIANTWHYEGVYAFYDMQADPEDYEEIITPSQRKDRYYQVLKDDKLLGYFVIEPINERVGIYELGLGLSPARTGNGLGEQFVNFIIDFLIQNFQITELIFNVVEFNIRAQKVYQKVGAKPTRKYKQKTNQSTYTFIEMRKTFN